MCAQSWHAGHSAFRTTFSLAPKTRLRYDAATANFIRGGKLMSRVYNVVDADGHILEPLDLWDKYIDPKFRDRAPRIIKDNETGRERLVIEEHQVGDGRLGIGRIGAVGARQGVVAADTMEYKEGKPGGFDPHARIPDMDADGIDAAFLYPSLGLFAGAIHDPQLAA